MNIYEAISQILVREDVKYLPCQQTLATECSHFDNMSACRFRCPTGILLEHRQAIILTDKFSYQQRTEKYHCERP